MDAFWTSEHWQRLMDQVLGDLWLCFVYVDNILIFSKDLSYHVDHLREVFFLCRKHGLTIRLSKCKFAVSKIEFLGHLLSPTGCSPLANYSAAIFAFPPPSNKPALQRFLGMLNFYRKFLRGVSSSHGCSQGSWEVSLLVPCLSSVPKLIHSSPDIPKALAVDASDTCSCLVEPLWNRL